MNVKLIVILLLVVIQLLDAKSISFLRMTENATALDMSIFNGTDLSSTTIDSNLTTTIPLVNMTNDTRSEDNKYIIDQYYLPYYELAYPSYPFDDDYPYLPCFRCPN